MAWNCTPASACWRKNCPRSTQNAIFCRVSISWHTSVPDMEVMLAVLCPRIQWPLVLRHCSQGVWLGPTQVAVLLAEGWPQATGHPHAGTLAHCPTFHCVCDTCAYAQVCLWVHSWYCIAHPSTGRKFNYSTLASNVITLNRRGTFPLLNSLVCSASLSRGSL